jgi:hypothetical protein
VQSAFPAWLLLWILSFLFCRTHADKRIWKKKKKNHNAHKQSKKRLRENKYYTLGNENNNYFNINFEAVLFYNRSPEGERILFVPFTGFVRMHCMLAAGCVQAFACASG